jgi:hypothetical protein
VIVVAAPNPKCDKEELPFSTTIVICSLLLLLEQVTRVNKAERIEGFCPLSPAMPSIRLSSSFLLPFAVLLVCWSVPALAFGAGNIGELYSLCDMDVLDNR